MTYPTMPTVLDDTTRELCAEYFDSMVARRDWPSDATKQRAREANANLRAHCGGIDPAMAAIHLYEQETQTP